MMRGLGLHPSIGREGLMSACTVWLGYFCTPFHVQAPAAARCGQFPSRARASEPFCVCVQSAARGGPADPNQVRRRAARRPGSLPLASAAQPPNRGASVGTYTSTRACTT